MCVPLFSTINKTKNRKYFVYFANKNCSIKLLAYKSQIYELKKELAEKICTIDIQEDESKRKESALQKSFKTIQTLMIKIKSLEAQMNKLTDESRTESLQEAQDVSVQ